MKKLLLLFLTISSIAFGAAGDRYIENLTQDKDIVFQVNKAGVKTEAARIVGSTGLMKVSIDPTAMSNADATRLGLKEYVHGTTYNGGNAPTITGQAGFAADSDCVFIPYQMQSGDWRLKFNIRFGQTSSTTADITIAGVTFLKLMAVQVSANNSSATTYVGRTTSGTGTIVLRSGVADTQFSVSGDVELSSKPNWAY